MGVLIRAPAGLGLPTTRRSVVNGYRLRLSLGDASPHRSATDVNISGPSRRVNTLQSSGLWENINPPV